MGGERVDAAARRGRTALRGRLPGSGAKPPPECTAAAAVAKSPGPVCRRKAAEEAQSKGEEEKKGWAAAAPLTQTAFGPLPAQRAKRLEPACFPELRAKSACEPTPSQPNTSEPLPEPACKPQAEPPTRVSRTLMGRQLAFRPVSPCNLFPFYFFWFNLTRESHL